MSESNSQIRRLLWTGGWDSTYRLIELSRKNIIVEPVYVSGDNRLSESQELTSMNKMLKMLKAHPNTRAILKDIKIIDKKIINIDKKITEAYQSLRGRMRLGTQYEWLAGLTFIYPSIEIGIVLQNPELERLFKANANITKFGDSYQILENGTESDVYIIFGGFSLPLINYNGPELRTNIIQWGYEDIMENIWFCHQPFFNQPCGICKTCTDKINLGMFFLFPSSSLERKIKSQKLHWKIIYKLKVKIDKFMMKNFKKVWNSQEIV